MARKSTKKKGIAKNVPKRKTEEQMNQFGLICFTYLLMSKEVYDLKELKNCLKINK